MKTLEYIVDGLKRISDLNSLEKFDFLISSSNAIAYEGLRDEGVISKLAKSMEALRYELAYNKGVEAVSARLDKVLCYEILRLSLMLHEKNQLDDAIKGVLYFENNHGFRNLLLKDLGDSSVI